MKRKTTIVLFASIFAVAVGTLGFSSSSATTMMAAPLPPQDQFSMIGHVEYTVLDSDGNIKQYLQYDNIVVNDGKDCAADAIFGEGTCVGTIGTDYFNYIGIGNGSSTAASTTDSTLSDGTVDTTGTCATTNVGGDMARKQVTPVHTPSSSSTGTIIVLDTSASPFTFDASNATTITDAGIFNKDYGTPSADNKCGGSNVSGNDWDMFARQLLGSGSGITVNDGDSLAVKWSITLG